MPRCSGTRLSYCCDQQHATDADQRAFTRLLGILTKPHPTLAGDGGAVLPIDAGRGQASSWHTDVTFVDRVPASSVLRHIDVREEGYREEFRHLEFETEHLVVRVHPETGEPALLLGHFVRSFPGLGRADFNDLFGLLQRHITRLENTVRWTWRDGDIAIWDNRATQHYAVADYDDLPRLLHRITIAGDIPVGVHGDTSIVRKGDASHYSGLAAWPAPGGDLLPPRRRGV